MKKKILLFVMSGISILAYSQSGQKWSLGGNSTSAGDVFGTTNNQPIKFVINNTTRMVLDTNGKLKILNFAGNGGSIVTTDANGGLNLLAPGNANQVLFGNGTWGNLPAGDWLSSGNNLYWTAGSVGVGAAPNSSFKLDVAGDARVQNNLYVGGGVLISQKVEASNSLKTDTVHSATGTTKFTGNVILKQQFQVDGNTLFNGSVQANNLSIGGSITTNNNLSVAGATNLNGLTVSGDLVSNNFKLGTATDNVAFTTSTTSTGAKILTIGGMPAQSVVPPCIPNLTGAGIFQQSRVIVTTGLANGVNMLDMRNDGTNGYIEFAHNSSGNPQNFIASQSNPSWPTLKINSACNGNVEIGLGGGYVSTSSYFEAGGPVRNSLITSNIFAASTRIGQRVTTNHANIPNTTYYNTQLFVNRPTTHALSIFNTATNANGDENFVVYGDGSTAIGGTYVPSGYKLAVNGLMIAQEVVVELPANWPDYVFKKDYKLLPLAELDKFVKKENHLPEVPSAEQVEKSGIELAKMNTVLLKKVEELTLYIIELDKQVAELKKQSQNK